MPGKKTQRTTKRSAAPKRKPAGSRSAAVKEQERRTRAITGISLIAFGVLLGAYMIFTSADSQFLGEVSATVPFGLFGIAAYVLPLFFIGGGVLCLREEANPRMEGSAWFLALGGLAFTGLMQAIKGVPYEGVPYMQYLDDAWSMGCEIRQGGGFVGGVLLFPIERLGGGILAYTLLISIILISAVAISGITLTDMTTKLAGKIAADPDYPEEDPLPEREEPLPARSRKKQQKMFTLDLDGVGLPEKSPGKKAEKRKTAKKVEKDDDDPLKVLPLSGELHTVKGEKPRIQKPEIVKPDIWDEIEPVTDTPLVITPAKSSLTNKADAPLPDTEQLFGAKKKPAAPKGKKAEAAPAEELPDISYSNAPDYTPPSFNLLSPSPASFATGRESPNDKAKLLVETLANFNIDCKITNISVGPVLTRFELQPAPGIRVSRITSLSNDIALALAAQRVRIEAPIPGKAAVGIEIPNKDTVTVVLRDIVESKEFLGAKSPITMALGKDISGKIVTADLAKMPHMLIAGATGSGKSVCINDIIISMVYKSSPDELKMILVDPKMVELSVFAPLPHLLIPVVTEPKKAAGALRWAVNEMTMRYKKFTEVGARDLTRYNDLMDTPAKRFPKLVVIIDELADLMIVAPDEVEDSICRIAQLGRASGIHLIVATQRPSADVITGLIKANIPSRCAFAVSSGIDSRIILDMTGAEKLLGRGDMLFHPNGANKPIRLQCAFVSDEEVERIVHHFAEMKKEPSYDEQIVADVDRAVKGGASGGVFGEGKQEDELLGEAVRIVLESGQASISMIQRRLRVGYARAARLIDIMDQKGYVSEFEGSKPRKVLIKRSEFEELFGDGVPLAGDDPPPEEGQ